jgi:CRP-like cAMP-binding protein
MDANALIQVIQTLNAEDAFRPRLDAAQWRTLAQYLSRHEVRAGDKLLVQGERDRALYLLGQGSLQVYMAAGAPGSSRIAILRPGAVCGEPGLFSDAPRMATVEAMTACVVFALRPPRFEELAQRVPMVAVEVLRAAGAVMAQRMRDNLTKQMPLA